MLKLRAMNTRIFSEKIAKSDRDSNPRPSDYLLDALANSATEPFMPDDEIPTLTSLFYS